MSVLCKCSFLSCIFVFTIISIGVAQTKKEQDLKARYPSFAYGSLTAISKIAQYSATDQAFYDLVENDLKQKMQTLDYKVSTASVEQELYCAIPFDTPYKIIFYIQRPVTAPYQAYSYQKYDVSTKEKEIINTYSTKADLTTVYDLSPFKGTSAVTLIDAEGTKVPPIVFKMNPKAVPGNTEHHDFKTDFASVRFAWFLLLPK